MFLPVEKSNIFFFNKPTLFHILIINYSSFGALHKIYAYTLIIKNFFQYFFNKLTLFHILIINYSSFAALRKIYAYTLII